MHEDVHSTLCYKIERRGGGLLFIITQAHSLADTRSSIYQFMKDSFQFSHEYLVLSELTVLFEKRIHLAFRFL